MNRTPTFEMLGLVAEDERVYGALLEHPHWDLVAFAVNLEMSIESVEATLDRLADRALVNHDLAAPSLWRPVHPELGLGALLATLEANVLEGWDEVQKLRRQVSTLANGFDARPYRTGTLEHTERVVGPAAVSMRLTDLAAAASTSVDLLVPTVAVGLGWDQLLHDAVRGGDVAMRSVHTAGELRSAPGRARVDRLRGLGVDLRVAPSLALPTVLLDRRTAAVPIDEHDVTRGLLVISFPPIVTAIVAMFDLVWRGADTADGGAAPLAPAQEGEPTPLERELLALLAAGCTDEHAAKRMGVSVRTVRRMVAALMVRLKAQSRFQAGLRAGEQGWLDTTA
ncbi:transcriptional regulator, LuxR family [Cellulomonas flavigena DSM 20109]|uniref:Transcriptional regulator, LuxR family n=1 Tax=Cellulomonas flavigena (strain ATCC 482 / DSM 20109 / BCRC 11376 / JCM 18109 / NBRC 3775 / NCIMB 8073 / NRS 134) TaxID=446466 RepID=D5UDK8_CELFN|nr:LuxR C-terminal-related transcriptional regulator [Cellulomonas flavigena]ADG76464.1 transcriptional regulator, LuxR family [Cellulomonas flavigena DSM 20109]